MIKGILRNTFPPSIFAGGWRGHRTKGRETYPAHFHQLGDHDNTEAVLLPNHPPEVIDHLLLGACRRGDTRWRYRWGKWERKKGDGKVEEGREKEDKEEGGQMSHKSEKIAAITMNVEALCNPCQGIE